MHCSVRKWGTNSRVHSISGGDHQNIGPVDGTDQYEASMLKILLNMLVGAQFSFAWVLWRNRISTWRSGFCGYSAKLPTSSGYNYKVFIVQDLFWTEQRFVLGRNVEKSPCIAAICFLYLISQNSANQYLSSTCWSKCARPWQK